MEKAWSSIQAETFANWINHHVKSRGMHVSPDQLGNQLSDGTVLLALLEQLTGEQIPHKTQPKFRYHRLENATILVMWMTERCGFRSVSCDASAIVDGDDKLILSLVWLMVSHFTQYSGDDLESHINDNVLTKRDEGVGTSPEPPTAPSPTTPAATAHAEAATQSSDQGGLSRRNTADERATSVAQDDTASTHSVGSQAARKERNRESISVEAASGQSAGASVASSEIGAAESDGSVPDAGGDVAYMAYHEDVLATTDTPMSAKATKHREDDNASADDAAAAARRGTGPGSRSLSLVIPDGTSVVPRGDTASDGDMFSTRPSRPVQSQDNTDAAHGVGVRQRARANTINTVVQGLSLVNEQTEQEQKMRYLVVQELVTSERVYVGNLNVLVKWYAPQFSAKAASDPEMISPEDARELFCNIPVIYAMNSRLLEDAEMRLASWSSTQRIGDLFLAMIEYFKVYQVYLQHYNRIITLLAEAQARPGVSEWLRTLKSVPSSIDASYHIELDLIGHLICPIQRIPRYVMILHDLVNQTRVSHPDYQHLTMALERMKSLLDGMNAPELEYDNVMKILDISGMLIENKDVPLVLPQPHRRFVRDGELSVDSDRAYHAFLFNDLLLLTLPMKRKKEALRYKIMEVVELAEAAVKVDRRLHDFGIWIATPHASHRYFALSAGQQQQWVSDIAAAISAWRDKQRRKQMLVTSDRMTSPRFRRMNAAYFLAADRQGFLFMQVSNGWDRRWFVLKEGLLYFYKTESDSTPCGIIRATSCAARPMDVADQAHAFEIVTPTRIYFLHADSEMEQQAWLAAVNQAASKAGAQSQASGVSEDVGDRIEGMTRDRARSILGNTGLNTEASRRIALMELLQHNTSCADCRVAEPRMASLKFGVFLCNDCAFGHREIGSVVKSVTLDDWTKSDLQMVNGIGNAASNAEFEATLDPAELPGETASRQAKQLFVAKKYLHKCYVSEALRPSVTGGPLSPTGAMRNVSMRLLPSSPVEQRPSTRKIFGSKVKTIDERYSNVSAASIVGAIKAGYLMKQGNNMLRDWRRRWVVIDEESLVYYRSQHDPEPAGVISLLLAKVAPQRGQGRFDLITSTRVYSFYAPSDAEAQVWVEAMRSRMASLSGASPSPGLRTSTHLPADSSDTGSGGGSAAGSSEKDAAAAAMHRQRRLAGLAGHADNAMCADCESSRSGWVSLAFGVFLCEDCAAAHGILLNGKFARLKALAHDKWSEEQVTLLESMGNRFANEVFEARVPRAISKPVAGAKADEKLQWIRAKYIQGQFVARHGAESKEEVNRALYDAVANGNLRHVYTALAHSPDVDNRSGNDNGETALHRAVIDDLLIVCCLLLESRCDINIRDDDQRSPLHLAAAHKRSRCAELLLTYGADPTAVDATGATSEQLARSMHAGTSEIVNVFDRHQDLVRARRNSVRKGGRTPGRVRVYHDDLPASLADQYVEIKTNVASYDDLVAAVRTAFDFPVQFDFSIAYVDEFDARHPVTMSTPIPDVFDDVVTLRVVNR